MYLRATNVIVYREKIALILHILWTGKSFSTTSIAQYAINSGEYAYDYWIQHEILVKGNIFSKQSKYCKQIRLNILLSGYGLLKDMGEHIRPALIVFRS
jgi:hypothetical protein